MNISTRPMQGWELFAKIPTDSSIVMMESDNEFIYCTCLDGSHWLVDADGNVKPLYFQSITIN